MRVMNVDPKLLGQAAVAQNHAYQEAIAHIAGEIKGHIPELMETLAPEGPYAYTIMPEVHPDGSVRLPILTTRGQIHDAYKMIRGYSELLAVREMTEIRGQWYLFQDNMSAGRVKSTGVRSDHQTLGLFPSGRGKGITGELIWVRVPRSALGTGPAPADGGASETELREQVLRLNERFRRALESSDVDGVLETLNDGAASAIRDYVDDTGTLTSLEGLDAHRAYFEALFDKYEFISVDPLYRICEEWYVFTELRFTVKVRAAQAGNTIAFHTAEFHIPAKDGRFIARVGHGTDPE